MHSSHRIERSTRRALAGLLFALPVAAFARSIQGVTQQENAAFSASVTGFQTSIGSNGLRYVTATVHFQNRTKKPLILGADRGKITVSDDQGNHYVFTSLRGIGIVNGTAVDPKFVLPAGGGGDALFELRTRLAPTTVRGVSFDFNLAAREITPLEGSQYRLGTEHLVEFTGIKPGVFSDAGSENSVDAGPFTAQITRSKVGTAGRWKTVEMTMRIKNTSDKPLILAYEATSSYGIDSEGNRFGYGSAGSHDTSVSGIGMTSGASADPQFSLAPGESKDVRFTIVRANGREVAGTEIAYYVALQQLEILPSNQIREVRQFSLTFPGLSGLK